MASDRCHPQPAEAVPVHSIATAGAGGSDGMRSRGPGGKGRGGISPHRRSSRSQTTGAADEPPSCGATAAGH